MKILKTVPGYCLKMNYKGFEISIAFEGRFGRVDSISKADIRVYKDDVDVTRWFDSGQVMWNADDLAKVFTLIDSLQSEEK